MKLRFPILRNLKKLNLFSKLPDNNGELFYFDVPYDGQVYEKQKH